MKVVFKKYKDYVIRNIGELILLINIRNNEIYEIDYKTQEYISYAKNNMGNIDENFFLNSKNSSLELIKLEIKELIKVLD